MKALQITDKVTIVHRIYLTLSFYSSCTEVNILFVLLYIYSLNLANGFVTLPLAVTLKSECTNSDSIKLTLLHCIRIKFHCLINIIFLYTFLMKRNFLQMNNAAAL